MRNAYTLLGVGFIVIIAIALLAFNRSFTPDADNKNTIINSSTTTMALSLTSADFTENGSIPSKFTCDAKENESQVNPQLSISGVPEGAKSLALLMDDPDIPQVFKDQRGIDSFDHWTLFNIGPETKEIAHGMTVGVVGQNGAGKNEYAGPCPPREYEPSEHRYFFKLYALDIELSLQPGATKKQVEDAMEGHIIAKTELIGKYKRP